MPRRSSAPTRPRASCPTTRSWTIDQEGVGELVQIGAERGRRTRPDIKMGICGEHGGDPKSIDFCRAGRVVLRVLLAVPRADRPARRSAGGAREQKRDATGEAQRREGVAGPTRSGAARASPASVSPRPGSSELRWPLASTRIACHPAPDRHEAFESRSLLAFEASTTLYSPQLRQPRKIVRPAIAFPGKLAVARLYLHVVDRRLATLHQAVFRRIPIARCRRHGATGRPRRATRSRSARRCGCPRRPRPP